VPGSLDDAESYWAIFRTYRNEPTCKLAEINISRTCILVMHSALKGVGDGPYKRECPECKMGILLCTRKSGFLLNYDRCVLCGQTFKYGDDTIGGECVYEPREVPP
jgi:hypothetical protein